MNGLVVRISLLLSLYMAKDLSGTTAATEKDQGYYQVVYLVEIDADAPDVATSTLLSASRKYTLSGDTYSDNLVPLDQGGLDIGWSRVRVGGGLAAVASANISVRNEEKHSDLTDTYFLENDTVRVYVIFCTGAETSGDKVQLYQGVIENYPYSIRTWDFDIIDGSDKDFREIPAETINWVDHPYASLDAIGRVKPVAFGAVSVGPYDGAGAFAFLAPCRCTNQFTRQYTSGLYNDANGTPFQYYAHAKRYAEVLAYTQTGGYFTVDDATRKLLIGPTFPLGTNDVTGWLAIADGDYAAGVTIAASDDLDVQLGGCPKLGTVTAISLVIKATGGYNYNVLLDGVSKTGGVQAGSGDTTVVLTASDHADNWNFELYSLEIDGTGAATIKEAYLDVRYDDQLTADRQGLTLFQKITGWEDQVARYNPDGATNPAISGAGNALSNPAHVYEAILRAKALMNRTADEVNLTALDTAATARTGWAVATVLDQPVSIDWLNEFGFQFAMHFFKDYQGKWTAAAQDKTRVPAHTFLAAANIAVRNPDAPVHEWEWDIRFARTPMREVYNEFLLRYAKDRATGQYGKILIASGKHRVTGTCAVVGAGSTGTLTDGSATFQTDGVPAGDTVYVQGDRDYTLDSVDSQTQMTISADVGDVNDSPAGTTYYCGPNLDGRCKRSQLRYKAENPLGKAQTSILEEGGYTSDLIGDDTTADKVLEQLIEWRSQRRLLVELATWLNAVDAELGDAAWLDHPWLPPTKRPILIGTLGAAQTAGASSAQSASNQLLRTGDYVLIDSEVEKVTAVNYSGATFDTTRAQCNTTAAAHSSGASIYRLNHVKWEVIGLKPDLARAQIRVEMQEMPPSYKPTGRVVATGYPDYDAATAAERTQSGWSTKLSGRVVEEDDYSAISYVGPDTGTY